MAKMGRLTPDQWGTTMPAHNPSYKKGPWFYRDTEALVITYVTDEDAALDIMPAELELIEPATAFMVLEFNNFSTSGGPYGEVYTADPVHVRRTGLWLHQCRVRHDGKCSHNGPGNLGFRKKTRPSYRVDQARDG